MSVEDSHKSQAYPVETYFLVDPHAGESSIAGPERRITPGGLMLGGLEVRPSSVNR